MLDDLIRGFEGLGDPRIRGLLFRSVLISAALFFGLMVLAVPLLGLIEATGISWLDGVIRVLSGIGVVVLVWLVFPIVAVLVLSLFLDQVAEAVEQRDYPPQEPAPGQSLLAGLAGGLRFAAIALLLNLLVLPLYLLPGPNLIIYLALNGYLIGREYFELVAARRLDNADVRRLRRRHRGRLFVNGVAIAGLLLVPFVAFAAPVIGTSAMVHAFERMRRLSPGRGI